jgi:hypothetical protein
LASRWTVATKRAPGGQLRGRERGGPAFQVDGQPQRPQRPGGRAGGRVGDGAGALLAQEPLQVLLEAPQAAGVAGAGPGRQRVDRPRPAGHGLAHHPPGERHGRFQVAGGQVVGLVEHHEQAHRVLGDAFQEGAGAVALLERLLGPPATSATSG